MTLSMRPRIAVTALAVAGLTAVTACGQTASDAKSGSGTLSLWSEWTNGAPAVGAKHTIAAWDKAHPKMKIKHRPIANESYFPALRTGMSGANPPDVVMLEAYQNTRDFVKAKKLVDLTAWWNSNKTRFVQYNSASVTRACTVNGKIYCVPVGLASHDALYYNQDLLTKNGVTPPKTYDELVAASEKFKKMGITPLALGDKDGWPGSHWYINFLVQRCGSQSVYSAIDGKGAKWNDRCFVEAAADLQNLVAKGFFPRGVGSDDYDAMTALFLSGKSPFMQTGSWFAGTFKDSPPSFKVGVVPFPKVTGAAHQDEVVGEVGDTMAIPVDGKNQKDAYAFIDLVTSKGQAEYWASQGYVSAVSGAVANTGTLVVQKMLKTFETAPGVLAGIDLELPPKLGEDVMYNGVNQLLTGSSTAQRFSDTMQKTAASLPKS